MRNTEFIKVIYIISKLNQGGPINQLLYMCRYLDRSKVSLTILTLSPRVENKITIHDELITLGYQIIELNLSKKQSILKAGKIIKEIILKEKIQIVHSFGFRADFIVSRLKNVIKISSVRNTVKVNAKYIYGSLLGNIIGTFHLYTLKKFDKIIACSYSVQAYLSGYKIDSIVIQNTIDNQSFESQFIQSKKKLRTKIGLPLGKIFFITVNSKLPGKNVEFLIDIFTKNSFLSNYILIVTGFSKKSLIRKYKMQKNIIFTGMIYNFYEYLRAADYFISASMHEGMPNAPLEALSLGIPVLLSDINSHVEILATIKKYTGEIFNNNNWDDFHLKLETLLDKEYEMVSINSQKGIKKFFSAYKMAEKFQEIYLYYK